MGYYRSRPHSRPAKQVLRDRSNKKLSTLASFGSNPQNILLVTAFIANLANFRGPLLSIFRWKISVKTNLSPVGEWKMSSLRSINDIIYIRSREEEAGVLSLKGSTIKKKKKKRTIV